MSDTIHKVGWLHVADRKLLGVRTAGRGLFYIPGGKPEAGEDDFSALIREIAEELGVALAASTIRRAGSFAAPADGHPGKIIAIEAYYADYLGNLSSGFEIAEHRFLSSADTDIASPATREVLKHLRSKNVID